MKTFRKLKIKAYSLTFKTRKTYKKEKCQSDKEIFQIHFTKDYVSKNLKMLALHIQHFIGFYHKNCIFIMNIKIAQ